MKKDFHKKQNNWLKKTGATDLFEAEKDDFFKGSLENIYQTFDGKELYPSTLMLAESQPEDRNILIKVIVNLFSIIN